ncbi:MAG: Hpt domain-containing protein [Planctomycetota bacterium]|jgi:chemotaxis protein histidine kinase CheA
MSENDEMLSDFRVESVEGLAVAEAGLLAYENDDEDGIHRAFRALHTIKGGAGFLELGHIQHLAHQLENLLDLVRQGSIQASPEVTNTLLMGFDRLSEMFADFRLGHHLDSSDVIAAVDLRIRESSASIPILNLDQIMAAEPTAAVEQTPVVPAEPAGVAERPAHGPTHFGAYLVDRGLIDADQLTHALRHQQQLTISAVQLLVQNSGLTMDEAFAVGKRARDNCVGTMQQACDEGLISAEAFAALVDLQQLSAPPIGRVLTALNILPPTVMMHQLGAFHDARIAAAKDESTP